MKTVNTFGIQFIIRQDKLKDGKAPIYARITIVRDLFVFCFYTGLAYVDVMKLTANYVVRGIDGEDWIKIVRQKTNIPINTPVLPQAKQIMKNIRIITGLQSLIMYFQCFRIKK